VYLGTAFVPLPSSAPEFKDITTKKATYPKFELDNSRIQGVDIHLRKLDTSRDLHRRVVSSLRIGAPVEAVWNVLTDYERLPEFIPNLEKSELFDRLPGAPEGYYRIRQVVSKIQTYMQLQADSVLDVVERPFREIQFRQVSGFVKHLQGKWVLEPIESEWGEGDTLLTYALEIRTPHSDIPLELIEPVFEQAALEGLPVNLMALGQEVRRLRGRPALQRLCGEFDSLRNELVLCYGRNNVLPTRQQLRKDRRSDLDKAITAHGGASAVQPSDLGGFEWMDEHRWQRDWGGGCRIGEGESLGVTGRILAT